MILPYCVQPKQLNSILSFGRLICLHVTPSGNLVNVTLTADGEKHPWVNWTSCYSHTFVRNFSFLSFAFSEFNRSRFVTNIEMVRRNYETAKILPPICAGMWCNAESKSILYVSWWERRLSWRWFWRCTLLGEEPTGFTWHFFVYMQFVHQCIHGSSWIFGFYSWGHAVNFNSLNPQTLNAKMETEAPIDWKLLFDLYAINSYLFLNK